MSATIDAVLAREAADTLEKLAFIFAFAEEAPEEAPPPGVTARVVFRGPFTGTLVLSIDPAALPELAANMLGIDEGEPIEDAQQHDALKETLNIVCGNVLPAIAGHRAVFDLAPPEIGDPAAAPSGRLAGSAVLSLDEGMVQLWLYVDGDPAQVLPPEHRGGP